MTSDFRAAILAALPRARIKRDEEGWEFCPGRLGRLEDRGLERDGSRWIYAYTDRPRMIMKLLAIPGIVPCQIGDQEAAARCRTEDADALTRLGGLFRLQTRREVSLAERARLAAMGQQFHFAPGDERSETPPDSTPTPPDAA